MQTKAKKPTHTNKTLFNLSLFDLSSAAIKVLVSKRFTRFLGISFGLLAGVCSNSNAQTLSLHDALQYSFTHNPKTQANDLRVEGAKLRAKSAGEAALPTFSLSYSAGESKALDTGSQSGNQSVGANISMNLYDGGAINLRKKAADYEALATEARYNSTNSYIQNTKGAISNQVVTVYEQISRTRQQIAYDNEQIAILETILKSLSVNNASTEDKTRAEAGLSEAKMTLSSLESTEQQSVHDFKYFVQLEAPNQIDNQFAIIESLKIPATQKDAIDIALKKSPDLQATQYSLDSSRASYEASLRSTNYPRLDAYVSGRHSGSSNPSGFSQSDSASIGINVNWSFSLSGRTANASARKYVDAAERDRDSSIDDLKQNLEKDYPSLAHALNSDKNLENIIQYTKKALGDAMNKLENHENVEIKYILDMNSNLYQMRTAQLYTRQGIILLKFDILRTTGTLFDRINGIE